MYPKLLQLVLERVDYEAKKTINIKRKVILSHCMKIVTSLLSYLPFVVNYGDYTDNQLTTLYSLFEQRQIPEYDTDIIKLICFFLSKYKKVTQNSLIMYHEVRQKIDSFFDYKDLLELINLYLLYGSETLKGPSGPDFVSTTFEVCSSMLKLQMQQDHCANFDEALLLSQLAVQVQASNPSSWPGI